MSCHETGATMTAVLAGCGAGVYVLPEEFTFSDENPLTGEPFARSVFEDLPPWVQSVVEDVVRVSPSRWDDLAYDGEVFTVVGPFRVFDLRRFLAGARARGGAGSSRWCPDCRGSLAQVDPDGSLTGMVGAVCLCHCASPSPRRLVGRASATVSAVVAW